VIVVSNTSPVFNLAAIGQLKLLNKLYGMIIIPQAVHHEITVKGAGQAGSTEIEKLKWIEVKTVLISGLNALVYPDYFEGGRIFQII